jgi:hypothetical protein
VAVTARMGQCSAARRLSPLSDAVVCPHRLARAARIQYRSPRWRDGSCCAAMTFPFDEIDLNQPRMRRCAGGPLHRYRTAVDTLLFTPLRRRHLGV